MTEPIEKITDETVIGSTWEFNESHTVRVNNLEDKFSTLLLTSAEKDANAKKAKAWDDLIKMIQVEMVESDKEGNIEARDAFYTVESWMQDLLQM
jgi:hypothetical protein